MGENSSNLARRTLFVAGAATAVTGLGAAPALALDKTRRTDFAEWQPITDRSTVAMSPRRVTMHIADDPRDDIYGPGKGPGNSYAHFYNRKAGSPLQHQTMDCRAAADLNGSDASISVEHQGVAGDAMTGVQITNLAKIFAWAHVFCGVPNRIATVGNTNGLAWHRLGVSGNFGTYNPNDRRTWSRAQTGEVWSSSVKLCPTDKFINQLDLIYERAQIWVNFYRNPPPD
jgi:hypothetical protein